MGEWISVEDRLPEIGKMWDGKSFVVVDYGSKYEYDTSRYAIQTTMGLVNQVRHPDPEDNGAPPLLWVPLPEPPETAGGEDGE